MGYHLYKRQFFFFKVMSNFCLVQDGGILCPGAQDLRKDVA